MRRALLMVTGAIVLWGTLPAAALRIVRGPYLQRGAPTEITVVWRTDTAAPGVVRYGTALGALDQTVRVEQAAVQHELRITGLSPATRYYYSVGDGAELASAPGPDYAFVTSPPVGSPTRFRAWIIGDSGTGDARQAAARNGMLRFAGRDRPDLFLHMGDMAYSDGKDSEFQRGFFEPYFLTLRHTVTWPTLGNHEGHSADSATESGPYYDAFVLPRAGEAGGLPTGTEAYYSFDHGQVHFVVLDSHDSSRAVDGAMLTWLAADLAATLQPILIAFWHHPPYTKGSHDSDTERQLIEMRENALPILEAAGVDLVMGGHSHIYERSHLIAGAYETPSIAAGKILDPGDGQPEGDGAYVKGASPAVRDGAVYVVAGHGGARIRKRGTHPLMAFTETELGTCLLDVENNHLTLRNVRFDGVVSDSVTLVKGSAFVITAPDGRERIAAGSTTAITWTTVGSASTVDLARSLDDGETWSFIARGVANTGRYAWSTPDVAAKQVRVRVSDPASAVATDTSDGSATLYQGADTGPTNRAPVMLPIGDLETPQETLVILQLRSIDPDGDPVRYRVRPLPEGATLDAPTGLFTWVPSPAQSGRWWLTFEAVDPGDASGSAVARITVRDLEGAVGDGGYWPPPDAGGADGGGASGDAGGEADGGDPAPTSPGCSCSLGPRGLSGAAVFWIAGFAGFAFLLAVATRRRR